MLNYINDSFIKIECYAAIGLEPFKIGEGEIVLKDLLMFSDSKN